MSIQLEIYDLVKLRDGRIGVIRNRYVKDREWEPCVYLQTGKKTVSENIPLEEYFMGSFSYNNHSSKNKGNDPQDIIAIGKGGSEYGYIYFQYGMEYFQAHEPKWDWINDTVTKENIVLKVWDMVKLRNGDIGLIQYDIDTYFRNAPREKTYDNPGLKIFVQKNAEEFYELDAGMYWGVEAYRDEVRCEEYDIIAYHKDMEKFPQMIRDYFRGGAKKVEEDYVLVWDWEDEEA